MKRIVCVVFAMLMLTIGSVAQIAVHSLLTENTRNPLGLDITTPRFSWQLSGDKRNILQAAYEVQVFGPGRTGTPVWRSGKINSSQSVFIPYGGNNLESGKKYRWQVQVWDNTGSAAKSDTAFFQMALLQAADWKAKWIEPGYTEDSVMRPSPLFRKEFSATKKIASATAYITAHGLYEAKINGKRIGDAYFTPGWTAYKDRLQYQVYDVTDLIGNGKNAIAVSLASGWYRGIIGFSNNRNVYGKDIALLLQLDIMYTDGSTATIVSDESWRSSTGSIRYAEIYNGETIDAREEKKDWTLPGYNDAAWSGVKTTNHTLRTLIATYNEPVRKKEVFRPVRIFKTPLGEQVIDFGQNLVGWVTIKVQGRAGDKIVVSHSEVMDKAGNFYTTNLRAAKAQDTYIIHSFIHPLLLRVYLGLAATPGYRWPKINKTHSPCTLGNY